MQYKKHTAHNHICPNCSVNNNNLPQVWIHTPNDKGCSLDAEVLCPKCDPSVTYTQHNVTADRLLSDVLSMGKATLRITTEAHDSIVNMAYKAGYIKSIDMGRHHGLGEYIEIVLSRQSYTDTRPDYMKRMDGIKKYFNRKFWIPEGEVRRYATFKLTPSCMARLYMISREHGICNMYRVNGPTEKINNIGLVLEAIGRGWLT